MFVLDGSCVLHGRSCCFWNNYGCVNGCSCSYRNSRLLYCCSCVFLTMQIVPRLFKVSRKSLLFHGCSRPAVRQSKMFPNDTIISIPTVSIQTISNLTISIQTISMLISLPMNHHLPLPGNNFAPGPDIVYTARRATHWLSYFFVVGDAPPPCT